MYGSSWPYPSYPPYYAAPPPGYYFGTALATGLVFAAGAAVVGGLWGWASPGWGGGYANVNQYNYINTNRSQTLQTVGAGALGVGGLAISPARLADRRAFPAVRKSPYPAMRCGLRHAPGGAGGVGGIGGAGAAAWAVLGVLGGRAVQAGWAVLAVPAGRAVRGAWEASAVAGRPGGRRQRCWWSW